MPVNTVSTYSCLVVYNTVILLTVRYLSWYSQVQYIYVAFSILPMYVRKYKITGS